MLSDQPKKSLPHREPFLLVDRLVERSSDGRSGIVEYDVTENLDVLKGHFPGNPILPGVIQIEVAAQSALWVYAGVLPDGASPPEVLFRGTDFLFKKVVKPGCTLRVKVHEESQRKKYFYIWKAEITVGSEVVSRGELSMVLLKAPVHADGTLVYK